MKEKLKDEIGAGTMLQKLRIRNFKIWKDTGEIKMAPITLFFGANSSGKSSIGQFLMMLKQTVESPDRKAVFFPGDKNSAVQLGSYQEMVFQRDPKKEISFDYTWRPAESLELRDPISEQEFSGNGLLFTASIGLDAELQDSPILNHFSYKLFDNGQDIFSIGINKSTKRSNEYTIDSKGYSLVRRRGRAHDFKSAVRFYGFPDEVTAYHQNADFVQDLNLLHEKLFRSIYYLGPLRTKAERLYSWTGIEPESVGSAGAQTVGAILAARTRQIGLGFKKRTKPFEQVIASKLEEMGLVDEFQVKQISEHRKEYEVKVRTKGSKFSVDLSDVGFGISQVLPVLVECFYAPRNSIIIMEQPEIHLHPSAQAALADVVIDIINSRESGEDRNIQLIIETHSEHFLRRLQRRIAENRIGEEKVSVYFANINKSPSILEPLQIDQYGNILNWPDNFFGNEMDDIAEQAKAALKKRAQQAGESADE